MNGYGIDSVASFFTDYGYTPKEELRFPAKKLKALWFSPPSIPVPDGGSGISGPPLPRVFISELLVDQMSPQTQVSIGLFHTFAFVSFLMDSNLNRLGFLSFLILISF